MKKIFLSIVGILGLAACVGNKKESGIQTTCHKGTLTHKIKLTELEMSAYAKQLPLEIHDSVQKKMKEGELIEAVKIIRGCLDIDLKSTKGITDRMKPF